ncbi:MAG: response regulator [Spirochaetales bacterium]|jgi:putative two-component system response regulator|nr:response regulator [Spirochaetales bacterium]
MNEQRRTIMLVDDDEVHLNAGKNILKDFYNVFPISSGEKLFEILEKVSPDMILLDVEMPEMDGYAVMKKLTSSTKTADIPVMFLSAHIDPNHELKGLGLGAVDYIYKPFSPILLMRRIENHMLISFQKKELRRYNAHLQTTAQEKTDQAGEPQNSIINTLAELIEVRENAAGGHITRIQKYLKILIDRLISEKLYAKAVEDWTPEIVISASQLHDAGKIKIPDSILNKPGKLTPEEFELVKNHADWGVKIIESIEAKTRDRAFLSHAKIFAASHHEKWNGAGYPLGLQGETIPLHGRLLAIADVYDALISKLPYKNAVSPAEAKETILAEKGAHFDPVLVEIFESAAGEFAGIAKTAK